MKRLIRSTIALLLLGALSTLTACFDNSNAGASGLDEDEVLALIEQELQDGGLIANALADRDARIATLETTVEAQSATIATLETRLANVTDRFTVQYQLASSGSGATKQASLQDCDVNGGGVPAFGDSAYSCESSTGYLYAIPVIADTSTRAIAGDSVYWSGASCDGTAYIKAGKLGSRGLANGTVLSTSPNDPDYMVIEPGSVAARDVAYQSFTEVDGSCSMKTGDLFYAFTVIPNDPVVTGVENALIAGPTE